MRSVCNGRAMHKTVYMKNENNCHTEAALILDAVWWAWHFMKSTRGYIDIASRDVKKLHGTVVIRLPAKMSQGSRDAKVWWTCIWLSYYISWNPHGSWSMLCTKWRCILRRHKLASSASICLPRISDPDITVSSVFLSLQGFVVIYGRTYMYHLHISSSSELLEFFIPYFCNLYNERTPLILVCQF